MIQQFQPIVLSHPNGATATLCLYGAHVTSWKLADGEEKFFLSEQAKFQEGKSIRGGVPIIFPQFNEFGSGSRHGFARTSAWALLSAPTQNGDRIECELSLVHSDETKKIWPHNFSARYLVSLGENSLTLRLKIQNTGEAPFDFTAALHSYFKISALNNISLTGLKQKEYWNNDGSEFSHRNTENETELIIPDAIDRVYFDVEGSLSLSDAHALENDGKECDQIKKNNLKINQLGFSDTVVWNPGEKAVLGMSDMVKEEYQNMLCVEAAAIDRPVVLNPDETWVGSQNLEVNL
ncbi:MAG: D-hexose-6-phosphate mutarotase [Cellvibrionaceae bacterium]